MLEIMTENVPQINGGQNPNQRSRKLWRECPQTPYLVTSFLNYRKSKIKKKSWNKPETKNTLPIKEQKLTSHISSKTMKARVEWNGILNKFRDQNHHPVASYPVKVCFKGRGVTFSDKQNWNIVASMLVLQ